MEVNLPLAKIKTTQLLGAELLSEAGLELEPAEVAVAIEKHRWAWRPAQPRTILIAESHVFTSPTDIDLPVKNELLPAGYQNLPTEFVRMVYCLGYGEPALLDGKADPPNAGTRQYWNIFGRLADKGSQPGGVALETRLKWKLETLEAVRARGIWLLDASLHGICRPGGQRIGPKVSRLIHEIWWKYYGSWILAQYPTARIWMIGKGMADTFNHMGIPFEGWVYQPQARRHRGINMEYGWLDLLASL